MCVFIPPVHVRRFASNLRLAEAIFPAFAIIESKLFSDGPPTLMRKWLKNLLRTFITLLMGAFAYQMSAYLSHGGSGGPQFLTCFLWDKITFHSEF